MSVTDEESETVIVSMPVVLVFAQSLARLDSPVEAVAGIALEGASVQECELHEATGREPCVVCDLSPLLEGIRSESARAYYAEFLLEIASSQMHLCKHLLHTGRSELSDNFREFGEGALLELAGSLLKDLHTADADHWRYHLRTLQMLRRRLQGDAHTPEEDRSMFSADYYIEKDPPDLLLHCDADLLLTGIPSEQREECERRIGQFREYLRNVLELEIVKVGWIEFACATAGESYRERILQREAAVEEWVGLAMDRFLKSLDRADREALETAQVLKAQGAEPRAIVIRRNAEVRAGFSRYLGQMIRRRLTQPQNIVALSEQIGSSELAEGHPTGSRTRVSEAMEELEREKPVLAEVASLELLEGYSIADVAEQLGLDRSTADSLALEAKRSLQRLLRGSD